MLNILMEIGKQTFLVYFLRTFDMRWYLLLAYHFSADALAIYNFFIHSSTFTML